MATGATDINTGPGFYGAMNTDMGPSYSPGQDITMALSGSTDHSGLNGPSYSMVPRLQQGHKLHLRPGLYKASGDHMGYELQYGPWLQLDHEHKHGLQQKPGSGCHHGPKW